LRRVLCFEKQTVREAQDRFNDFSSSMFGKCSQGVGGS
jgi:hypothetical protein